MSQYNIQDPDEMMTCPLDKAHSVLVKRMQYHLMKCKKNFKKSDIETCPFNAKHVMLKPGLQSHLETCPDKADLEAIVAYENQKKCGDYMPGGFLELPVYETEDISSEEIWDDEILPATRTREDHQFPARQDHKISPGFVNRWTTNSETEKIPQEEGQRTSTKSQLKKSIQSSSAVFANSLSMVGTGRGRPVKVSSPPSQVGSVQLQQSRVEEWNKQLKKIEKKLKQINLLEKKMEDGQALTDDEASKLGKKRELMKEREDLQLKMNANY
uniref:Protein D7-like n=1 Tax=Crassostrea virginica TaxID=6565 RepID=A0A8B8EZ80_CRAVI|nr:protein D7-like [Crassostrea virginica]